MSIKDMLLSEATILDFFGVKTTKYSKSDDAWYIPVDGRTIAVKAASLRVTSAATSVAAYKRSSQPSIFNLIEIFDDGKVSKVIKTIPKPLNVIATVAEIISNETKDNKLNDVVMIRLPASMGTPTSVISLIDRFLKKNGVPFVQYGTINVGDKGTNYVFLARKGKSPVVSDVFGIKDEDVKNLHLNDLSDKPEVIKKIVADIEPKIKKAMPTLIKLNTVVGGTATSEYAREFIKNNPPVSRDVDPETRPEFKFKDIFQYGQLEDDSVYLKSDNPTMEHTASNILNLSVAIQQFSIADGEESKAIAIEILRLKPTMKDFVEQTEKFAQVKEMIVDATGDDRQASRVMASLFANCLIEQMDIQISNAYEDYRPEIDKKDVAAISRYCGSGYSAMNLMLVGNNDNPEQEQHVLALDEAFKTSSVRVSPNLTVYRGSRMNDVDTYGIAISKLFHFRTFVSTSMNPRVGFTFGGNEKDKIGYVLAKSTKLDKLDGSFPVDPQASIAFMIKGLDKIPVIIPGTYSPYPRECEVILPRGTTIRIEKLAAGNGVATPTFNKVSNVIMDCTIVPNSEISVNEVVYDGDEFMNTGRLVEFRDFIDQIDVIEEAKKKAKTGDRKMDIAANMLIGVNALNSKKNLTAKERAEIERMAAKFSSNLF